MNLFMLRRSLLRLARRPMSSMASQTPLEDVMRLKITETLKPITLEIYNDSHLHSHHKAMVDSTSKETHFRVVITSDAFQSKMQPARHRMVYALLKDEMAREGGIHALQLKTRTPQEEKRQLTLENEQQANANVNAELESHSVKATNLGDLS